jgi:hypothetical protein
MRPSSVSLLSLGMLIGLTGACSRSPSGEERVSLDKVSAVAKAAAEKEREHGKMVYELKGRGPKGKKVKGAVFSDGKPLTVDAELRAATAAVGIPLLGTD